MSCIVCPGTFDPITLGHEDIILRASKIFDHVIVGVSSSRPKTWLPLFQRLRIVQNVFQNHPNISVEAFDGLLVHFLKKKNISLILRGVRNYSDCEYEFRMAGVNKQLAQKVETIFLISSQKYQLFSGETVRTIYHFQGDISTFISTSVLNDIRIFLQGK